MRTSGNPESELVKAAAPRKLSKPGEYPAEIEEVTETESARGNAMFKATVVFVDTAGEKWVLTDYLVDKGRGGLKLRHACAARGVLAKFEAGFVDASDLPGPVLIKVGIEKRRGWPDRLVILDYAAPAAASSSVLPLRAAG